MAGELVAVLVDEDVADLLISRGLAIPMPATCKACGGHMTVFEEIDAPTKRNLRACDRCEVVEVLL